MQNGINCVVQISNFINLLFVSLVCAGYGHWQIYKAYCRDPYKSCATPASFSMANSKGSKYNSIRLLLNSGCNSDMSGATKTS